MTTKERQERIDEVMSYARENHDIALDVFEVVTAMLGYDEDTIETLRGDGDFSYSDLRRFVLELSDDDLETLAVREANKA